MAKKINKKSKQPNKISRAERNEHLTNWYMINLVFGVLGILALLYVKNCYGNMSLLLYMQTAMWILTAFFVTGSVTVYILGKCNVIKNSRRAVNYSVLLGVCALITLWLALYNKLRPIMEDALRAILNNPSFNLSSYWNTRLPIILISAYLVISFIIYLIKLAKK